MRFNRNILSLILLVSALAYTLWFVFAGFGNHQDPLYWLYKYEHMEGGWMAVGTLLTGGAIVRLFGAQLLPLRLFGWLCTVAAIALPYACLLTPGQRRENLHWLALAYLLMGYGAFQEFSPGTLSVLLLSAVWVLADKERNNPSASWGWGTAILAGLAVAARFPNILVLLVLIPVWKKRSLWAIPLAALAAGLVYLLGCLFVTPAITDSSMTAAHEISNMVSKLWENGGKLVGYILLAVGVLAVINHLSSIINHHLTIPLGLFTGLTLVYFACFTTRPLQWYNTDLTYLVSAFCLVMAVCSKSPEANYRLLIGAALMVVATLGTDTAWLKLFPAVLCLLAVAAVRHPEHERNCLWCVLAVLAVLVVFRMTTNSIGQSNLTRAATIASVSPYKGIAIRETEQKRLLQYKADYDSLSNAPMLNAQMVNAQMVNAQMVNAQMVNDQMVNDQIVNVLALGQEAHLMRAVTGCEAARYNEFWSNIFDSLYTAKYRDIIQSEYPVVFCSFTPQFKTKPEYTDGDSEMERMLLKEGYTPLDRKEYKYMIYLPPNTIHE